MVSASRYAVVVGTVLAFGLLVELFHFIGWWRVDDDGSAGNNDNVGSENVGAATGSSRLVPNIRSELMLPDDMRHFEEEQHHVASSSSSPSSSSSSSSPSSAVSATVSTTTNQGRRPAKWVTSEFERCGIQVQPALSPSPPSTQLAADDQNPRRGVLYVFFDRQTQSGCAWKLLSVRSFARLVSWLIVALFGCLVGW